MLHSGVYAWGIFVSNPSVPLPLVEFIPYWRRVVYTKYIDNHIVIGS